MVTAEETDVLNQSFSDQKIELKRLQLSCQLLIGNLFSIFQMLIHLIINLPPLILILNTDVAGPVH